MPSRRLGRSLGVDLIPFKTCSYDCVYCQLGPTTHKTTQPGDFVDPAAVAAEIEAKLAKGPRPDHITLAGSGEPTLCSRLGEVIERIKGITDVPVALLTNGSLLWQDDVRAAAHKADLVLPTLDAADEGTFRRIHRPADGLSLQTVVRGMELFRKEFAGRMWLEVFVLAGVNDTEENVRGLNELIARIRPDRVQLNTAVRPTSEQDARAVPENRLEELAALFEPRGEVIADYTGVHQQAEFTARREDVLSMIRRRPCSMQDIARGLGIHMNEAGKHVGELTSEGLIKAERRGATVYYVAV